MAYADQAGRATVDAQHPHAFGVCDSLRELGIIEPIFGLRWKWRGDSLQTQLSELLPCLSSRSHN